MNQYAEKPLAEQFAELRAHLAIMAQADRDARAETREQIEMLSCHLGLARHTLDAVHGEWIAIVKLLSGSIELLRESGNDETADAVARVVQTNGKRPETDTKLVAKSAHRRTSRLDVRFRDNSGSY